MASVRCKSRAGEAVGFTTSKGGMAAQIHGQLGNRRNGPPEHAGDVRRRDDGDSQGSNSYRMVTDYRAVNDTIEPAAMLMPDLEDEVSMFAGPPAWCTLDMLQG